MEDLTRSSKYLSMLLRHRPESIELEIDVKGWASVPYLIKNGKGLTQEIIQRIVLTDSKGRYELSADGRKIRALHGHSIDIEPLSSPVEPPMTLYHGTASKNLKKILKEGLKPMKRKFVHLSEDTETAISVGTRYGNPVVLKIRAKSLNDSGHLFYKSDSGVWLTDFVPPEFLEPTWN